MCGSDDIESIIGDRTYTVRNRKFVIKNVPHEKCNACGEKFFDQTSYDVINHFYEKKRKAG